MGAQKSELSGMKNIGKASERWLNSLGVYTHDDLKEMGSVQAYKLLKGRGAPVSLNLVYAIEGALMDEAIAELPQDIKDALRIECEEFDRQQLYKR